MPENINETTKYLYYEKDGQPFEPLSDTELSNYLKQESTSRDIIKKFEIFKRIVEKHQKDFDKIRQ